jgi:hypothetical protein
MRGDRHPAISLNLWVHDLGRPRETKAFAIGNRAGKWSIATVQIGNNFAHTASDTVRAIRVWCRSAFQDLPPGCDDSPPPTPIEEGRGYPSASAPPQVALMAALATAPAGRPRARMFAMPQNVRICEAARVFPDRPVPMRSSRASSL